MITTCHKEIPFRWIFFAVLPWASFGYLWSVCGAAFVFSLRKFVDNPAALTFILSLPTLTSLVIGPCTNFLSDRIWTRFGRRKPFIITSWVGIVVCLILMPLMPNFWALFAVYILYNLFSDLNAPLEPLKQEIIPPHERGRATGTMQWCQNLASAGFYFLALGRFDDVRYMAGVPISGESVLYWSGGLLLSVMLLLITLGIKELDQKSALVGQRLSLRNIASGLFDRELWPVYLLVFGSSTLSSGLGPLNNLLYTDQWNYTKQDMGINFAVGGAINMVIIGLLTIFADRLNRMKAYRTLICISVTLNFSYFCYVTFVLPDQRPSLVEIITFGETGSIVGLLTGMVYIPLVYDYIRRNKMGTYGAGAGIVNKLTMLVTLNGVGLFIWAYATLFQPPAGEMVRVVLHGDDTNQRKEIRALVDNISWVDPANQSLVASSRLYVSAWQAGGVVSPTGRCWEFRLRDESSEKLAAERDHLLKEKSQLISQTKNNGQADAHALSASITTLDAELVQKNAQLASRCTAFEQQVVSALGSRLIANGDQVLSARLQPGLEITLPTLMRPDAHTIEKKLSSLRAELPSLIDVRPIKTDTGYALTAGVLLPPGSSDQQVALTVEKILRRTFANTSTNPRERLLAAENVATTYAPQTALSLDLMTVEEPLDSYVSPIHRGVNLLLRLFDAEPKADRKLSALARSLRDPADINQVRVQPGSAPKTISITALIPSNSPRADKKLLLDPIGQKLNALLQPTADASQLPQARAFYDRVENNAATQRLTVARPVIASDYAPIKYNYMSGYLWMFLMGLIGISITLFFSRLENKGYIHKRGVEESEAS